MHSKLIFFLYIRNINKITQKMKILVCISHVPDTTSKINFTNDYSSFDANGVQYVINPNDEFGLTRAMWFKERQNATVDVANVGGPETEPTLRKALAIGADAAFRVAAELTKIAKEGNYDLIIAGRESIDYNGGMVPGIIACNLNASFVNNCIHLDIDGEIATAVREIDGGKETLSTKLPLVIGGQESDLKIPNMRGIMMARQKPLIIIEPEENQDFTKSISFEKPAPKGAIKMVDAENIDELISLLHNEAKVL